MNNDSKIIVTHLVNGTNKIAELVCGWPLRNKQYKIHNITWYY